MRLQSIAKVLARSRSRLGRRKSGGRRCRIALRPAMLMLAVLLFPFQLAFGTAPSTQTVTNSVTDFNAVVQMDKGGSMAGTGSIVMKFMNTQDGVPNYYVCVLTADHVVSSPTRLTDRGGANAIGFGNSAVGGGAAPTTYNIVSSAVGGSMPNNQDLAMELVKLGPNANNANGVAPGLTYNGIVPLQPVSLTTNGNPPNGNNNVPSTGTTFTVVGYGMTGTANDNTSYTSGGFVSAGTKRFMNNVTTGVNVGANIGPYTNNQITWNPRFGNGQGATFSGDSGAPMIVTSTPILPPGGAPSTVYYPTTTYNGVDDVAASNNVNPTLFGVVEGSMKKNYNPTTGVYTTDGIQFGVALTQADITWINKSCSTFMASVPEPSTWVLLAVGFSGVVLAPRRAKARAAAA